MHKIQIFTKNCIAISKKDERIIACLPEKMVYIICQLL